MSIRFRRLEEKDYLLLHSWLNAEHVMKWYGKKPLTINEIRNKYEPYISGVKPIRAYIIEFDDSDIGYIQTYLISDYPEYNAYVQTDGHTAGVDLFIGHEDYVHKGKGAPVMRLFLEECVFSDARVEQCVIGPEPENRIAIRMYEKAGFEWYKTIRLPDEDAPEYLMKLTKDMFKYKTTTDIT